MAGTSYSALDPLAATRTTATQTPAHFERGHPDSGKSKRQIREARSDKKTEKRIGSVLTAARNEEKRVGNDLMAALNESSPFFCTTWSPSASNSSGATFGNALKRTQCGATGGPAAASAEDPKRALVHSLQNDLARISVRLKRLEELLSS